MSRIFVAFGFLSLLMAAPAFAKDCLRLPEGVRIDTESTLNHVKDMCEVGNGLGIFTSGVKEITFPNLVHAHTINIEADDLEAINFPKLESVDYLRISGGDLKVAEFPRLHDVGSEFYVKSKNLEYLHLPSLRTVYKWYITKNPNLKAVFADKVYNITILRMDGNPQLVKGNETMLRGVTETLTYQQQQDILDAEKNLRAVKLKLNQQMLDQQPVLPPTGHPVMFDSFGQSYPYQFSNYWGLIGNYGYHYNYWGWTWW